MARRATVSRNGNSAPAAPTAGSAWRAERERGFVKTLFSGKRARLRPVDLTLLTFSGQIPDLLTPIVSEMLLGKIPNGEGSDNVEAALGVSREMLPLIDIICKAAFLEPRIVDHPQADDEIGIDDLDLADRILVFQIVTQGIEALRRFRYEPPAYVEAVSDRQDDQPETEPVGRGAGGVGGVAV